MLEECLWTVWSLWDALHELFKHSGFSVARLGQFLSPLMYGVTLVGVNIGIQGHAGMHVCV